MPQRRSHFVVPPSPPSTSKLAGPSKTPPSRQSKRIKSSPLTKVTPKKSPYFEHETSESESASEAGGDSDVSVVSSPPSSDAEEEEEDEDSDDYFASEEEGNSRKRKRAAPKARGRKSNGSTSTPTMVKAGKKGQELWRPGVKSSAAPGEEVYIKLPKARAAGSTPYEPSTIHPNTFLFLGDLKANNDREWLKMHDADYRTSKSDWDSFVESLTEKIIEKDETIPELPPKDLTFRIYRDVRFSKDPTPYKTHFSAAWSRTGRKGPYAAYYVQIQPKGSFIGAGVWHPEAAPTALLRTNIDRRSHQLKQVLTDQNLRKEFFGNTKPDEKKVIKAFADMNKENALKTKPKGYEADNPNIALLRLRNFTIGKKLKDDEVVGEGAIQRIADLIGVLTPFVTYLNSVVMPDGDGDSSDDDEDGEEDDANEEEGDEEDDGDDDNDEE